MKMDFKSGQTNPSPTLNLKLYTTISSPWKNGLAETSVALPTLPEAENSLLWNWATTISSGTAEKLLLAIKEELESFLARLDRTDQLVSSRKEEIGLYQEKIGLLRKQAEVIDSQATLRESRFQKNDSLEKRGGLSRAEVEETNLAYLTEETNRIANETEIKDFEVGIKEQELEILEQQNQRDLRQSTLSLKVEATQRRLLDAINQWEQTNLLLSPIKGHCVLSEWMRDREYLSAGTKVMTIRPIVDGPPEPRGYMKLPIANAGKIKKGLEVNVRLHNYPYKDFGVLHGTIRSVGQLPHEQFYNVQLDFDFQDSLQTSYQRWLPFQQLLEGEGEVITGRFSLFARIWREIRSERFE